MEKRKRIINTKGIILYLYDRVIIICIVALVFSVFFSMYYYKKERNNNESITHSSIALIIKQNIRAIKGTEKTTMHDIPYGCYNATAKVYVKYKDDDIVMGGSASNDSLYSKLVADVWECLEINENLSYTIDDLGLRTEYSDMSNISNDDLANMINGRCNGIHIFCIVVTDIDPHRAALIANSMADCFKDSVIKNIEEVSETNILEYAETEVSKKDVVTTSSFSKKKLVIYFMLGAIVGAIIISGIYIVLYFIKDVVGIEEDFYGLDKEIFGEVSHNRGRVDGSYEKLSTSIYLEKYTILGIAACDKYPALKQFTLELLSELKKMYGSICLVDAVGDFEENIEGIKIEKFKTPIDIEKNIDKVKGKFDFILIYSGNIQINSNVLMTGKIVDKLLLVAEYNKTSYNSLRRAIEQLDRDDANIGIIVNNARHNK